jgi:hypothetical protein
MQLSVAMYINAELPGVPSQMVSTSLGWLLLLESSIS